MISVYSGDGSQEAVVIASELKKRSCYCCLEASPLRTNCCQPVIEAAAEIADFADGDFVAVEVETAKVG